MPNLQALTPAQTMRVHQAEGYAWGRLDERDGPCGTLGASTIAADFGIYCHDVDPRSSIHDAWAAYVAQLEAWSIAAIVDAWPMPDQCQHCTRSIVKVGDTWVDPEATGDDNVWRETCDSHDTFIAEHEPRRGLPTDPGSRQPTLY